MPRESPKTQKPEERPASGVKRDTADPFKVGAGVRDWGASFDPWLGVKIPPRPEAEQVDSKLAWASYAPISGGTQGIPVAAGVSDYAAGLRLVEPPLVTSVAASIVPGAVQLTPVAGVAAAVDLITLSAPTKCTAPGAPGKSLSWTSKESV